MLSKVFGSALVGMDSHSVQVEVDVTKGFGGFEIVGLPDAGIRESRMIKNVGGVEGLIVVIVGSAYQVVKGVRIDTGLDGDSWRHEWISKSFLNMTRTRIAG